MQAEHFRGGGFIISPLSSPVITEKPLRKFHFPVIKIRWLNGLWESIVSLFFMWCDALFDKARLFFTRCVSVLVAVCCVSVFFQYFTFGTAIYYSGEKIACTKDKEEFLSALSAANSFAEQKGSSALKLDFKITPTIALKKNIFKASPLRDELLLCSGDFATAYTLYSDGEAIFSTKSLDIAKKVISEHITKYSMNGDASLTSEVSYKKEILPTYMLSTQEECEKALVANSGISVLSIVNGTVNKELPFEVKIQKDSSLYLGEMVTVTEGKAGNAKVSFETRYKNGLEESSRILGENVVTKPVNAVVRIGTKPKDVLESGLYFPVDGVISSHFGSRWGRNHEGTDMAVAEGTPVFAAECGTVCYASDNAGSYGKLIRIDHGYGVVTVYAHLNEIQVTTGQTVSADTQIALSGNTGRSTGPHLHFEVLKNDTPIDPMTYLRKR